MFLLRSFTSRIPQTSGTAQHLMNSMMASGPAQAGLARRFTADALPQMMRPAALGAPSTSALAPQSSRSRRPDLQQSAVAQAPAKIVGRARAGSIVAAAALASEESFSRDYGASSSTLSYSTVSSGAPRKAAADSTKAAGSQQGLVLIAGAYVLPHPDKMQKGGEDWFYISDTMRSVGVADGVGGWADIGVDSGAYARQLMGQAKSFADASTATGTPEFETVASAIRAGGRPRVGGDGGLAGDGISINGSANATLQQSILERAYYKTDVRGSSTACVLVLAGDRLLASNLGDSGFLVLRDGNVVFHSPQQQHDFNFPYQIGSADSLSDQPQSAQRFELLVQPTDVLVLGTDGLWDNCFDEEIASVINYCQDVNMPMDKTAQVLAHYARHRASDPKFASPFAYAAFQAGFAYMGGKMDDITVVVGRVADAAEVAGNPLPGQGGLDLTMPDGSPPKSKL